MPDPQTIKMNCQLNRLLLFSVSSQSSELMFRNHSWREKSGLNSQGKKRLSKTLPTFCVADAVPYSLCMEHGISNQPNFCRIFAIKMQTSSGISQFGLNSIEISPLIPNDEMTHHSRISDTVRLLRQAVRLISLCSWTKRPKRDRMSIWIRVSEATVCDWKWFLSRCASYALRNE